MNKAKATTLVAAIVLTVLVGTCESKTYKTLGYTMGKTFKSEVEPLRHNPPVLGMDKEYTLPSPSELFDSVQIGTEKNTITMIAGLKRYDFDVYNISKKKYGIKRDYDKVLNALERKYGKFDKTKAGYMNSFMATQDSMYSSYQRQIATRKVKGSNVVYIMLVLEVQKAPAYYEGNPSYCELSLIYLSEKAYNIIKKMIKSGTGDL